MDDPNIRIKEIRQKTKKLLQQLVQLKLENALLKADKDKLLSESETMGKKIELLQNKDINLHLSRALEDGMAEDATALKQKLDEYIREIEAVIVHLKN